MTARSDITMQPRLSILKKYINTTLDTLKLLFLTFKTFIQPYTGTDFTFQLVKLTGYPLIKFVSTNL